MGYVRGQFNTPIGKDSLRHYKTKASILSPLSLCIQALTLYAIVILMSYKITHI